VRDLRRYNLQGSSPFAVRDSLVIFETGAHGHFRFGSYSPSAVRQLTGWIVVTLAPMILFLRLLSHGACVFRPRIQSDPLSRCFPLLFCSRILRAML